MPPLPNSLGHISKTLSAFDENLCWWLLSMKAVTPNENGTNPPFAPTFDLGDPLTGITVTWPASVASPPDLVLTVTTDVDCSAKIHRLCLVKADNDTQVNPWFRVIWVASDGLSFKVENPERRSHSINAQASSFWLQGRGTKVAYFDTGLPSSAGLNEAFLTGFKPSGTAYFPSPGPGWVGHAGIHPDCHLWNNQIEYVLFGTSVDTLAANGNSSEVMLTEINFTWPGGSANPSTITCDVDCRERIEVGDWIKYATDREPNPWFKVASVAGDGLSFTIENPNTRTLPGGLQQVYIAYTSDDLGGYIGKTAIYADPAARVWDEYVHAGYQCRHGIDMYPVVIGEEHGVDFTWPSSPDPLGDTATVQMPGGAYPKVRLGAGPVPPNPTVISIEPFDVVRLDKDPSKWYKVVSVQATSFKISVVGNPLGAVPSGDDPVTMSRTKHGRVPGLIPHAKIISYKIDGPTAPGSVNRISNAIRALGDAVDDGVDIIFWPRPGFRFLKEDPGHMAAFEALKRAIKEAVDAGIFIVANPGRMQFSSHDRYVRSDLEGYYTINDIEGIVWVGGTAPKDFNGKDPSASDYDPTVKPLQSRVKNLHRPSQVFHPNDFLNPTALYPGRQSHTTKSNSFWFCAEPFGTYDSRYYFNAQLDNCLMGGTTSKGYANLGQFPIFDASQVFFDNGINSFNAGTSSTKGLFTCYTAALCIEAYFRKNGSKPALNRLKNFIKQSCRQKSGPPTDNYLFAQQLGSNGQPVFPKSATQQVTPAGQTPYVDFIKSNGDSIGPSFPVQRVTQISTPDSLLYGVVQDTAGEWDDGEDRRRLFGFGNLDMRAALDKAVV